MGNELSVDKLPKYVPQFLFYKFNETFTLSGSKQKTQGGLGKKYPILRSHVLLWSIALVASKQRRKQVRD